MTSATKQLDNWVTFRASTSDRDLADKLKSKLNMSSVSALVRQLLLEKANSLGLE